MRWLAGGLVALVSSVAIATAPDVSASGADERARVASVVDGDTIALASGARVRLLQIDTPSPAPASASPAPRRASCATASRRRAVVLEVDPTRSRRRLRTAAPLRPTQRRQRQPRARAPRRGDGLVLRRRARPLRRQLPAPRVRPQRAARLWGACPHAVWNPLGPATTGPPAPRRLVVEPAQGVPERARRTGVEPLEVIDRQDDGPVGCEALSASGRPDRARADLTAADRRGFRLRPEQVDEPGSPAGSPRRSVV